MKNKFLFILLILFAFLIRSAFITKLPLYGDELTMVYDEYSILKTGMDSSGQKLPLTFKMGAGRPGGYIYFSLPFVAMFGPTIWGERALSLLSGLGIITLLYFTGKKLFGEKVGVVAAILATISPWDIYLSRGGFEAHFALFLALLGILGFLEKKYLLWAISWGVAILTYPTFKLTLPLMFILLAVYVNYKKLISSKSFIFGALVLVVFGVITAMQTFRAGSEERFLSENIFADKNLEQSIIQRVNSEREFSTLPNLEKQIFINKGIEYSRIVFENYLANLSPNFLFLRGDGNPRHNPGEMGMLYILDLPLLIIGFALMLKDKKKEFGLLLSWILITPLATMFFPEAHALRNGLMLPAILLTVAYAFTKIGKKYALVAAILIILQLTYILIRIYTIAPNKFASFWSGEAKAAALEAKELQDMGQKVSLSVTEIDNIEYAYEVYAKVDPKIVISQYGKFPKVFGNVTITD